MEGNIKFINLTFLPFKALIKFFSSFFSIKIQRYFLLRFSLPTQANRSFSM